MTSLVARTLFVGAPAATPGPLPAPASGLPLGGLVVFMVLLFVGAAYLHRRFGAFGSARNTSLRLLSSLPLGDKRAIVLVEAERERMIVGVTSQSVQLICRLRASETASDLLEVTADGASGEGAPEAKRTFGAFFERALGRMSRP